MGHVILWWLTLLLLGATCHMRGYAASTVPQPTERVMTESLEEYLRGKVEEFKLQLHKAFEDSRIRRKREANSLMTFADTEGMTRYRIVNAQEQQFKEISEFNAACWTTIFFEGHHFVILGTRSGDLVLLTLDQDHFTIFTSLSVADAAYKIKAFQWERMLWLAVLHRNAAGTVYIQLYILDHNQIRKRQAIILDGESDMELSISRYYLYMAVSTYSRGTDMGSSRHVRVVLYEWKRTQFDMVASAETKGARGLALWDMDGTLYTAVAQERDDSGDFMVGSPVFVYSAQEGTKLTFVQVVRTNWPTVVRHFAVLRNHYIIMAGHFDAVIYWWAGDQFLEYQIMQETAGVVDVQTVALPNQEILLCLALKDWMVFYTQALSGRFIIATKLRISGRVNSLQFFRTQHNYYALLTFHPSSHGVSPAVYKLNLQSYKPARDPERDPLLSCMSDLSAKMAARDELLAMAADKIDRVWVVNKPQEVVTPVLVDGMVSVHGRSRVDDLVIIPVEGEVPHVNLREVREGSRYAQHQLVEMEQEMKTVFFRSKDQEIHGNLFFTKPVRINRGHIGHIRNDALINGVPISRLSEYTLKKGGHQVITGNMVFDDISVNKIQFNGRLNGIYLHDVMRLHGDQEVTGHWEFDDVEMSELVIRPQHTINGIDPRHFVTKTGAQDIAGRKSFRSLAVERDLDVATTTNGVDLSDFAKRAVLLHHDQLMTGSLTFASGLRVDGDMSVHGLINGVVNLTHMAMYAVDKHSFQEITGEKIFLAPVHVNNDVEVHGTLNGIHMEDIATVNTEQEITGRWTFTESVKFQQDLQTNTINGISLSEQAVRRYGEQQVTAYKNFQGSVTVLGDITMAPGATIDDVDPSRLASEAVSHGNASLDGAVYIDNLVVKGDARALLGINGFPIADLADTVWRKSVPQDIPVPVTFLGPVTVENIEVAKGINGYDIEEDFVRTFTDEVIPGEKTFLQDVFVEGPIDMPPGVAINDVDISDFNQSAVRVDGDYIIKGIKTFKTLNVLGNLIVMTKINGIDLSDECMFTDLEQVVTGHKTLIAPVTRIDGNLQTGNVFVSDTVNGIDLSEFANDVVMLDDASRRPIVGKNFINGLKVTNLEARGFLDGINLEELKARAVTLDSPQVITAPKNFTGSLEFGNVVISELNGMDLMDLFARVVRKDVEQVVTGFKTIKGTVSVAGKMHVDGLINDVDIVDLAQRAMSTTRPNNVIAPMTFVDTVYFDSLVIEEPARLDGIPLSEICLLSENCHLRGNVEWLSNLALDGNLILEGLLNGCDLERLADEAVYLEKPNQVIHGIKTFTSLEVDGDIKSTTINGIDIRSLGQYAVRRSMQQVVTGELHFDHGLECNNLILKNTVNGIDIPYIMHDAVRKNEIQTIEGTKVFLNPAGVTVRGTFHVSGDLEAKSVNDIDIERLNRTTVYKYGDQLIDGDKTFADIACQNNLIIDGALNGILVPEDLVLIHSNETIRGNSVFLEGADILGSLIVGGSLDGVMLGKLLVDRVTLDEEEVVWSDLLFLENVYIKRDLKVSTINDIPMESVVMKSGNFEIYGVKTFKEDLAVDGDVSTNHINEIDVRDLATRAVRYNRPETITDLTIFQAPIVVASPMITEVINDIDISEMVQYYHDHSQDIRDAIGYVKNEIRRQEKHLQHQFLAHQYQVSMFAYFDLVQHISLGLTKKFISGPQHSFYRSHDTRPAETLVLWTAERRDCDPSGDRCCETFATCILHVEPRGELTMGGIHPGRYFPMYFNTSHVVPSFSGFLMWTNTTSNSKKCEKPVEEETAVFTLYGNNPDAINGRERTQSLRIADSAFVKDAKLFEISNKMYLAVAFFYNRGIKTSETYGSTVIYRYDITQDRWSIHQKLETYGAVSLDVAIRAEPEQWPEVLLAVANRFKKNSRTAPSAIYQWNYAANEFKLVKLIQTSLPSCVMWLHHEGNLYVLFANEKTMLHQAHELNSLYSEPINVYLRTEKSFKWVQSIPVRGTHSLTSFRLAGETFVLAASHHRQVIYVLQWRGYQGLQVIQKIQSPGVEDVHVYWSSSTELLVAVASSTGHTKVLRAVLRGTNLTPDEGKPWFNSIDQLLAYQKTQPAKLLDY